ncbi:MAG: hypothetical protein VW683_00045 [Betaproteobacteria bacterium]|jgi:hypothetical protein
MGWDYKAVDITSAQDSETLMVDLGNQYGIDGWELIYIRGNVAYFKRNLSSVDSGYAAGGRSSFGELSTSTLSPLVQLDAIYGLNDIDYETFKITSGNAEGSGSKFVVSTGTSAYGYGVIRSRRLVRYRPGQGAISRFTAAFTTPHENTIQRAGLFAQEQSLVIGYEGTNFGITRQNGGKAAIYEVKITGSAASPETASIELNGTTYQVVVNGAVDEVAQQIEASSATFAGAYTIQSVSSSVYFAATSLGPRTGSTSFSSATADGTVTLVQEGFPNQLTFVSQSQFNRDALDGNGPSGMTLDHDKLNVWQIQYRWLGAGEIRYAIENNITGELVYFHHEHYSGRYQHPHLDNPSFKIGYIAANLSPSTVTNSQVFGSSMMGGVEGIAAITGNTHAASAVQSALAQNSINHMISIRAGLTFADKINLREVRLKQLSVGFDGNDPAEILLYFNSVGFSADHIYNPISTTSCVSFSTVDGTFTNPGDPISIFIAPSNGSFTVDLENLNLIVPPQNTVTVALRSGGVITKGVVGLTFSEQ